METVVEEKVRRGRAATTFSGEKGDQLIEFVSKGISPFVACRSLDLSYDTFWRWVRLGEGECAQDPYATFARRLREAQETAELDKAFQLEQFKPRGRRPFDLSESDRQIVLDGLAEGLSFRQICRHKGILYSTLASWLRWGGYPRPLARAEPLPQSQWKEPYITFVGQVLAVEKQRGSETSS
jgi:transposase-like protein